MCTNNNMKTNLYAVGIFSEAMDRSYEKALTTHYPLLINDLVVDESFLAYLIPNNILLEQHVQNILVSSLLNQRINVFIYKHISYTGWPTIILAE